MMVIGNHIDFDLFVTLTNHFVTIYVYDLVLSDVFD